MTRNDDMTKRKNARAGRKATLGFWLTWRRTTLVVAGMALAISPAFMAGEGGRVVAAEPEISSPERADAMTSSKNIGQREDLGWGSMVRPAEELPLYEELSFGPFRARFRVDGSFANLTHAGSGRRLLDGGGLFCRVESEEEEPWAWEPVLAGAQSELWQNGATGVRPMGPFQEGANHGGRAPAMNPDDDGDGLSNEDPLNRVDDDRDGMIDEDFAAISDAMCVFNWSGPAETGAQARLEVHHELYHWTYRHTQGFLAGEAVISVTGITRDEVLSLGFDWVLPGDREDSFLEVLPLEDAEPGPDSRSTSAGPQGLAGHGGSESVKAEEDREPRVILWHHRGDELRGDEPAAQAAVGIVILSERWNGVEISRDASADYSSYPGRARFERTVGKLPHGQGRYRVAYALVLGGDAGELFRAAQVANRTFRGSVSIETGETVAWVVPPSHARGIQVVGRITPTLRHAVTGPDERVFLEMTLPENVDVGAARRVMISGRSFGVSPEESHADGRRLQLDLSPEIVSALTEASREGVSVRVRVSTETQDRIEALVPPGDLQRLVGGPAYIRDLEDDVLDNYPNPFKPRTTIHYRVPEEFLSEAWASRSEDAGYVAVKVYNLRGQLVRVLVEERLGPGLYTVDWDGTDREGNEVASGVYFYQMQIGDRVFTRRMTLLR